MTTHQRCLAGLLTITIVSFAYSRELVAQSGNAHSEKTAIADQARAVFKKRCVSCHSQSQSRGGLDMTTLDAILAGSTSGSVVESGKPNESLLFTMAAHIDTPKMPPNAPKIPDRELRSISMWIESLDKSASPVAEMDKEAVANNSGSGTATNLVDGLVSIEALSGPIGITAIASHGSTIALSGLRQVLLYDVDRSEWRGALNFPEGDIFALRFTSDGQRLLAAGGIGALSGSIVCWDMQTTKRVQTISIEDDIVLAMDVSPDGQTIAAAGPKRIIEVIDLPSGRRKRVLRKHADWVTSLAFSPDGLLLGSGDRFGSVYLWDVHGGSQFGAAENHTGMVTSLTFSRDSNRLWSAGKDGYVKLWDLQGNKLIQRVQISEAGIADMQAQRDSIIVVDNDRHVTLIDDTGKSKRCLTLPTDATRLLCSNSKPALLLVGDRQSMVHIVDVANAKPIRTFALPSKSAPPVLARFKPRAVDRQLREAKPPAVDELTVAPEQTSQQILLELKQTLSTTRELLDKTHEHVKKLEQKIGELERTIKD